MRRDGQEQTGPEPHLIFGGEDATMYAPRRNRPRARARKAREPEQEIEAHGEDGENQCLREQVSG